MNVLAEQARRPTSFLEQVIGSVTLSERQEHTLKLDPHKDAARILYEGETLTCAAGSHATGYLVSASGEKSSVRQDLCHPEKLEAGLGSRNGAEAALKNFGQRAGRNKGEDVPIFAPPDQGAAVPETFVVRWRTRPPLNSFTAILQDGRGTELARVPDVSGAEGVLESDVLRRALLRYQRSEGDHAAKLTFHDKAGLDQSVTFLVLTADQELELKNKLSDGVAPDGLFMHVQRAAVFDSYKLYDEEAAEYEAALKEAPESRDLLRAAFNAYSRIGDFRTARSLRDRQEQVEGED